MISARFDQQRYAKFVTALTEGCSIQHDAPWTVHDMLALAGACYFAVMSHGPEISLRPNNAAHAEHREAIEESFLADIAAAIEFLAQLHMRAVDGEFDQEFDSVVDALVGRMPDGQVQVVPVSGFRRRPF